MYEDLRRLPWYERGRLAPTHTDNLELALVNAFWKEVWPGANGGSDGNAAVPTMKAMTTGEQDHLDRGCIATDVFPPRMQRQPSQHPDAPEALEPLQLETPCLYPIRPTHLSPADSCCRRNHRAPARLA